MNAPDDPTPEAQRRAYAAVILRSKSGKSVKRPETPITPENVKSYLPSEAALNEAAAGLRQLGFVINMIAPTHLSISGDPALFERIFDIKLVEKEYPVFSGQPSGPKQFRFESDRPLTVPPALSKLIEAVDLAPRIIYYTSATTPALSYDHMELPDDVARGMDAIKAHERGITGRGVALAIVDSGFMRDHNGPHPYFQGRNYTINLSDAGDKPGDDRYGHGTGVVACALAVAPDANCTVYKINSYAPWDAFSRAAMARPDIITNSWAFDGVDTTLQNAINSAIADGIVVLFATGDVGPLGAQVGWPGSEPSVISVGGAFLGSDDSITASDFACSGTNIYSPGRVCPDVCGLCGLLPRGIYIALPTQPKSYWDQHLASALSAHPANPNVFPYADETAANDGWIVASGTSAATPMVAGVCALMMQQDPALRGNPTGVLARLVNSCINPTASTGAGLVQAYRGVHATDIWMKDNPDSDIGLVPTTARRPTYPPYTHWTSPDIKVVAAPLANPQTDFDGAPEVEPIFNQDNYVYFRVRNRGVQGGVKITGSLYYADPSTSLSFPNDWKDGSSGIQSNGSIMVGGATANSQVLPAIPASGFTVTPLPFVWRPPDPSTATQSWKLPGGGTVGHFCLLSRTSSDDDPILFPGGDESSIVQDNNLSMKNELVYRAPKGAPHMFQFFVRGPRKMKDLHESVLVADVAGLPDRTEIEWNVAQKRLKAVHSVQHRESTPSGKKHGAAEAQRLVLGTVVLEPAEEALCRVTVRLPNGTKAVRYRLHIAQIAGRQLIGGVTLVSRVT